MSDALQDFARRLDALPFLPSHVRQKVWAAACAQDAGTRARAWAWLEKTAHRIENDQKLRQKLEAALQTSKAAVVEIKTRYGKDAVKRAEAKDRAQQDDPEGLLTGL